MKPGKPFHIVIDETAKRKVPSMVAFDGDDRMVGSAAQGVAVRRAQQMYAFMHTLLGKRLDSPSVEALRKLHYPYEFVGVDSRLAPGQSDAVPLVGLKHDAERVFEPEALVAMSFQHIKKISEVDADGPVKDCVITVCTRFLPPANMQASNGWSGVVWCGGGAGPALLHAGGASGADRCGRTRRTQRSVARQRKHRWCVRAPRPLHPSIHPLPLSIDLSIQTKLDLSVRSTRLTPFHPPFATSAAAVQYGIDRTYTADDVLDGEADADPTKGHNVLLYNMGSSSTKVTLVRYSAYNQTVTKKTSKLVGTLFRLLCCASLSPRFLAGSSGNDVLCVFVGRVFRSDGGARCGVR